MEAAGGVEVPEAGRAAAVALDFSAGEVSSSTPAKVPRRIRRRLLESRSSRPLSAEVIENKLKEADLRRRQFHDWLSRKARSKARSPSWSSQEEDHAQRLEAKLNAAEQKRLSLLAKAQKRLAQLDELRQAAKTGAEMRFEKQREELGSRVESRVQQAEANRLRLLEDHMRRRAAVQERKARSLLQRIARERKHKERICSSISQKRSAAEKKRMVLLEAEKTRAQARVMQARRVAKIVCFQRESERRRMKEQLENRLQRAKRQRAEYLRLRGNLHSASRVGWIKHGDILSRKLARCWRQFVKSRKTTFMLAQAFEALGVNKNTVKFMPFEQLARLIESSTTLQTAKSLLDRLESRFLLQQQSRTSSPENIDHLLRHLTSPRKRTPPGKSSRMVARNAKATATSFDAGKLSRYPVRAVLCAYMILGHPDAVFSEQGDREVALYNSALNFIQEFEALIKIILDGASSSCLLQQPLEVVCVDSDTHNQSSVEVSSPKTFRNQLSSFDAVWRFYLYSFVVWKVKDARLLEDDLVRAACQLELSMIQTCKITSEGDIPNLTHDMKAIQKQVTEDQKLLREKVEHLSGNAGLERMETALLVTRSRFFEAKDCKTPLVGHMAQLSPTLGSSSAKTMDSVSNEQPTGKSGNTKHVVRSLFGGSSQQHKHGMIETSSNSPSRIKVRGQLPVENEVFVNEILHMGHSSANFNLESEDIDGRRIRAKVKETMEKAFWDGVMEAMMEESRDYGRIIGLVREVRDELSEISPYSWKQAIHDSIDLDILSQVLESGMPGSDYLGRILEYALLMQRKLSAPATENELKKTHDKFLNELFSISQSDGNSKRHFVFLMVKGLRFVLEQIQALKKEIYKTSIEMLEPVMKGYAGVDFLQRSFTECYGPPSNAAESLTITNKWLSPLKNVVNEEWNEFSDSLSLLPECHALPPSLALRTGGNISQAPVLPLPQANASAGGGQLECSGEKLDVLLRLGLLKLACSIEGLTIDNVPETLKLNAMRLRNVQSKLQQIIVISAGILVLRQIFISEQLPISPLEMDTIIFNSVEGFFKLVDRSSDIGIDDIVKTIAGSSGAKEMLQSRKEVMTRVLMKSLQNDDEVFKKINHSVYLAFRAILFGGSGPRGRRLAEGILRKVGAAMLVDRLVNAAEVLIIMANVSRRVHEPWYNNLV
ncbi:hypothetical protein AXF42_Ash002451 [Apostasia shenzhenica]|uniref:T-complex protein 11 n=1 Tax=Apostasia shenzhenica TaxID=1088818 RepID=A0A2I0ANK4_9ASPA|nr:hypothetical protein AXF42_Ash002451 [Apostasia shenzhenica]